MQGRSNMKQTEITIYHQTECNNDRDCVSGQYCDTDDSKCKLGAANENSIKFPAINRRPKRDRVCPTQDNSIPKINQKVIKRVLSQRQCETNCRKTQDCNFFEWRKIDGKNDYCVLHEHFVLEKGHSGSISGLNNCENFQELFEQEENSCFLMDTRPYLRKLQTTSSGSKESCASACEKADNVSYITTY